MPIPALGSSGILPPYLGAPTNAAQISPFEATLEETAQRFGTTDSRREIFRGLLQYRQRLSAVGFTQGVQWLSGSFIEDIEGLEGRAPKDVDVVTFFHRPNGVMDLAAWGALLAANSDLFDNALAKAGFKVDANFISLDNPPMTVVDHTRFWFGLFSHRRNGLWKGMIQVQLAVSADDINAAHVVAP